jgi:hypothetical protein
MSPCPLDAESYDLISALVVRAGCVMEDRSVALVCRLPHDRVEAEAIVHLLSETAAELSALGAAAAAILRDRSKST